MRAADPRQLPTDVDALRSLVLDLHDQLQVQNARLAETNAALELKGQEERNLRLLIEKLKLEIAVLRRSRFGRSSEKLDERIEQLELIVEELESTVEERTVVKPSAPRDVPVRQALPAHLPRQTVMHEPACTCPGCGQTMQRIGEDTAEMLDFVPGNFVVIRHVRPKLACPSCERIVQRPAPSRPIERGLPGAGLLAHVAVSKFADHLPLYRQAQIYAREGVELDRSTLADWLGAGSRLVRPLLNALGRYVLAGCKLHADDTPVPVLQPGRKTTKTGRLWTYVRDDRPAGDSSPPAVWFRYTPDRKGERPLAHLAGFNGILQADAYAGFERLYERGGVVEAGCWAHVRRKFYEIHANQGSPIAAEALSRIQALYEIEAEIRGKPAAERQRIRQARAGPLLEAMHAWLSVTLTTLSKKAELAAAIRYALTRWVAMTRYRDDGRIEIDNNAAERALRAVALGRKNYLFAGSDDGGERAAAFYSLIGTAKLNGLDPQAYLRHVFERIGEHPVNRVDDLLPWVVAGQLDTPLQRAA